MIKIYTYRIEKHSIKYVGINSGILSGVLWGLDTVLMGFILLSSRFISSTEAIILAPIISAFLHDMCSSVWLSIFFLIKGEFFNIIRLLKTKNGRYIALAAIFGGPLGMTGYILSINSIGAGYTASISAIYPVIGAFFAYIILKDKLALRGWIGLFISILAVIIIGYSQNSYTEEIFIIGFIYALMCVLGWSLESVICAYGMKDEQVSPTQALQIRQLVSSICYGMIIIPIIDGIELVEIAIRSRAIVFIALISLIGTLSYIFYYKSINTIGSVRATLLNITYSFWAIIFEIILLKSPLTIKLIMCSILIILGCMLVFKE